MPNTLSDSAGLSLQASHGQHRASSPAPHADAPHADAPQADTPHADAPQVGTPQADAPHADAPQVDTSPVDTPPVDTPPVETPQAEAPNRAGTETPLIPGAKPLIGDEERAAVDRVLRSGMLAQGPEVAAFEREFAERIVGGRTCVAVNSGTAGLHLGLLAAGIGPGDEVIVPSFTFAATGNAVALTGATPVFADIEPEQFTLDVESVRASITPRTRGIMPVHLYGHPAEMDALGAVAAEFGLRVFEDAAQAHGATLDGRLVGTFGDFAMFSLYPTKNLTAGEGGMVSVASDQIARTMRLLRNQGMERQYENELIGFNARLTEINAAIGRVQLGQFGVRTEQRQANAAFFDANLEGVVVPPVRDGATHVYHQYTVRIAEDRDGFMKALREEYGVSSGVYYPIPIHRLVSLAPFAPDLHLPETERAVREVLSLPVHPALTDGDLERIVTAVNAVARAGS